MGKYDDMINMSRPVSNRPHMPVADRAKIFQPFAALRGYEELIKERQKLTVERRILTEQRREELDVLLGELARELADGNKPEVAVKHFMKDEKVSEESGICLGKYVETIGMVGKIDSLEELLWIGRQGISIQDIWDIKVERKAKDLFTNC